MRIKSFFAESVGAAMQAAHQEFGPDAVLITSRKSAPQSLHLGKYEVVAGTVEETDAPPPGRPKTVRPENSASRETPQALGNQIADLKRQIEGLRDYLNRSEVSAVAKASSTGDWGEPWLAALIDQDMEPELARSIVQNRQQGKDASIGAEQSMEKDSGVLPKWIQREIEERLVTDHSLGRVGKGPAMVALVGPPGAGKTTTIVKLAIRYGLEQLRPVHLISADPIRVGASAQLRSFAAILGVKFHHFDTAGSLVASLSEFREKDLLLIDTPGLAVSNVEVAKDLATVLSRHARMDVHLVLSASMRRKDMQTAINLFQPFGARRLIFTKLDETTSYGALAGESIRTAMPVSFLCGGPQIPEDLEEAKAGRMARLITGDLALSFASAA